VGTPPPRRARALTARARCRKPPSSVRCGCSSRRSCARSAGAPRGDGPGALTRAACSYEGQRDQLYSQQFNLDQTSFAVASMEDTKLQACPGLAPDKLRVLTGASARRCAGASHVASR
jgi:hypothetical protein